MFASKVKLSIDAVVNPLSAVIVSPSDVSVSPIVIPSLESFAFVIEPFSWSFEIPPVLIETAPLEILKSEFENDATPLELAVASSASNVIVSFDTVEARPAPPANVSVPPVLNVSLVPTSAARVNELVI